ncbi:MULTISPECIES: SDR family oxidoreductase [unclassified Paludibacterium]|uniref:SDR family oxidoreductase n=1 Tax=unclassified Paludibacterium TaxID=2618429 RepID=UPI001C04142A|nr:SDR family oxidoreductase [Paludibacterium sp. B53371]BEV72226.1 SDR family oxidoreductase [Paludibacterium sp. THUN1379]
MKALVTGAAGFIGSHLAEMLLEQGAEVVLVDDLSTGKRAHIEALLARGACTFHQVDIRDRAALEPCFAGVEQVFHLAGRADIVPSIDDPETYFSVNVQGTLNVLQSARLHGVRRLVYAASSSCYGIPDVYPTPETSPIRPEYPYALTKAMGEELVMHWGKVYHLPVVSLRLFNVYGPRSRTAGTYGAVFGVFLAQKLKGLPFTVVGDGEQSRDFTYVTDVARAFMMAGASRVEGEIMNVGSGGHYQVNRLVALLGGEKVHIPKRPGEPDCTFADTAKITRLLGWQAEVPLEQGVANMLACLEDWRDAPVWTPKSIEQATKSWFDNLGDKS